MSARNRLFNSIDIINFLTIFSRKKFPFYNLINFKSVISMISSDKRI